GFSSRPRPVCPRQDRGKPDRVAQPLRKPALPVARVLGHDQQIQDAHNVEARSDLYSLGATLYRLLTDRLPFDLPDGLTGRERLDAILTAHGEAPVVPLRSRRTDVTEGLAQLVEQLLAKRPDERGSLTAAGLARELKPF